MKRLIRSRIEVGGGNTGLAVFGTGKAGSDAGPRRAPYWMVIVPLGGAIDDLWMEQ